MSVDIGERQGLEKTRFKFEKACGKRPQKLTFTVVLGVLGTLFATEAACPATAKELEIESRTLGSIEFAMFLKYSDLALSSSGISNSSLLSLAYASSSGIHLATRLPRVILGLPVGDHELSKQSQG